MKKKLPKRIPGSTSLPGMAVKSAGKQTMLQAIPPKMYLIMIIPTMGLAAGLFYLGTYAVRGRHLGTTALIVGAVVLLALGGLFFLFRMIKKRRDRRRAAAFEENLKAEAAQGAGPVSDPAEAARVDEMRQKFQRGVDVFRQYGKSVYDFPWYVMVGEPGAGKTEAIRNSSINFPEGLQEKQQGVGGTYSMDWWFTDRAILLDTAGALLTESDSAARFEEFLKMLKMHRPDCPINGMIIAISVESLLLDDVESADAKGLNLARQLSMIQKTLGLRFSIYLMITKADLITGFKEFCDAPVNANYERQCFGWSNPHDLDTPIKPSEVCAELEQMVTHLRYRRWTILQDPVPKERDGRRINEVDALFTFPDAVSQVVKRLSRYLEIVFSDSEWSEMPPFFRGVYFTSSKREGAALDQQLAQALNMAPSQLPEGGIWAREKSMYLRELFLGKIFREKGLVTRIRDLGSLLRKRLVFYYVVTASLLVLFLGLGLLFHARIIKQIKIESPRIQYAHEKFINGTYAPIVEQDAEGNWSYSRVQQSQLIQGSAPLDPLPGFTFFRPLEVFYEHDLKHRRPQSRQIVIAGSVIKPLLDATRQQLLQTPPDAIPNRYEMRALVTMMKVKAATFGKAAEVFQDPIDDFVWPLMQFVIGEANISNADLAPLGDFMRGFHWTDQNWMWREDYASAFSLGFKRFRLKRDSDDEREAEKTAAKDAFKAIEDNLLKNSELPGNALELISELGNVKQTLDQLTGSNKVDIQAYGETWEEMKRVCMLVPEDAEFRRVLRELGGRNQPPNLGLSTSAAPADQGQGAEAEGAIVEDPYLSMHESGKPLYAFRYDAYESMLQPSAIEAGDLVGNLAQEMQNLEGKARPAPAYEGPMSSEFKRLCRNLAEIGLARTTANLIDQWYLDVGRIAAQSGRYPLVIAPRRTPFLEPKAFITMAKEWSKVSLDLDPLEGLDASVPLKGEVKNAVQKARKITDVVKLLYQNGKIAKVQLSLSASRPGTQEVPSERPRLPGAEDDPTPAPPTTVKTGFNIEDCTIYRDLNGRAGSQFDGNLASFDSGIFVDYAGWPRGATGPANGQCGDYKGLWGVLRAL